MRARACVNRPGRTSARTMRFDPTVSPASFFSGRRVTASGSRPVSMMSSRIGYPIATTSRIRL